MKLCPECKNKSKIVYRDILYPDNDKFKCLSCGKIFYRYEHEFKNVKIAIKGIEYNIKLKKYDCLEFEIYKQTGIDPDQVTYTVINDKAIWR